MLARTCARARRRWRRPAGRPAPAPVPWLGPGPGPGLSSLPGSFLNQGQLVQPARGKIRITRQWVSARTDPTVRQPLSDENTPPERYK